ncbi:MAG TPA: PHB depolymerase family esterase [Xanthobacteraceae bacterium]
MRPATPMVSGCLAVAAALTVACPSFAADLTALPALGADVGQSSVSGLSSGAFMAVQFGTAWSSVIRGVGVVAGGPFECAQNALIGTGPCMTGPPPPLHFFTETADESAKMGAIDPTSNLARQQVYVFHGTKDSTVVTAVTDETVAFYRHYLGAGATSQLAYEKTIGSGHAWVVPDTAATAGLNDCATSNPPYVNRCGTYDQAGVILRHIYGDLNPPAQTLSGTVKSFAQRNYTAPARPVDVSLANEGFVYVPKDCEGGTNTCRVHMVLHGCLQDSAEVGRTVVDKVGFNAWADTNRIIVLYPQTVALTNATTYNPDACWDWWGYLMQDRGYFTKSGAQIKALKAMLDGLAVPELPTGAIIR